MCITYLLEIVLYNMFISMFMQMQDIPFKVYDTPSSLQGCQVKSYRTTPHRTAPLERAIRPGPDPTAHCTGLILILELVQTTSKVLYLRLIPRYLPGRCCSAYRQAVSILSPSPRETESDSAAQVDVHGHL